MSQNLVGKNLNRVMNTFHSSLSMEFNLLFTKEMNLRMTQRSTLMEMVLKDLRFPTM